MATRQMRAVCVVCERPLHPGEKVLALLGATLSDQTVNAMRSRVKPGNLRAIYQGRHRHQGYLHGECYVSLMKRREW
jgi:hypothetical protein